MASRNEGGIHATALWTLATAKGNRAPPVGGG